MKSIAARALAATAFLATSAFAAPPTELFTPGLYANTTQNLECRVINVSAVHQKVTTEAFMATGAVGGGPYTQILAPGEAGGFSHAGWYANMYCKFTVNGSPSDFRVSVNVVDPPSGGNPERISVALPGF